MSRLAISFAVCLPVCALADDDSTTVIGRRAPGTASERRADKTELAQVPARTAEDFLQLVPGVHVVQHGSEGKGHQFFVRGFDAVHGSDVRVTVDGIPINEPSNVHGHGYVDLGFVIPELVLAVDAHKGAYALDQGDFGTAGAIDFALGVGSRDQGLQTAYQIGSTNRHRGLVVYAPSARDFVAVEGLSDAGFGENRSAQRATLLGRWDLWRDGGDRLTLLAAGYHADFGLPGALRAQDVTAGARDFYDAYSDDTTGRSQRGLVALTHRTRRGAVRVRTRLSGHWRHLRLDENFTGFIQDPINGDRHIQTHDALEGGLDTRLIIRLARSLKLKAHAGWRGGTVDQDELLIPTEVTRRGFDGQQHTANGALGVEWRPLPELRVEAGGRVDWFAANGTDAVSGESSDGSVGVVSPRVQIVASPHLDWELFAAYGRGFRSPDGLGRAADGADVTVADNIEAGARWTPSRRLSIGLAAFGVTIERETLFDHAAAVTIEQGATRRIGGELDARWDALSWLRFDGDVAVAHAEFSATGAAVPNAPRLLATLGSTVTHPTGWEASVHALWLGQRPLAFGATAGDAVMIDTGIGYRWSALRVRLDVENPLNLEVREGEAQFASRWTEGQSGVPAIHYFAAAPANGRLTVTGWF